MITAMFVLAILAASTLVWSWMVHIVEAPPASALYDSGIIAIQLFVAAASGLSVLAIVLWGMS